MNHHNASAPSVKPIDIVLPNKSTVSGKLSLWDEDPENRQFARLTLQFESREITGRGTSYNQALNSIRQQLEKEGVFLKCYGSSRNVWPSSVTSGMGRGGKAYKLYMGRKGERKDVVSIFDCGPDLDICTVNEQEAFYNQWLLSVGISRKKAPSNK